MIEKPHTDDSKRRRLERKELTTPLSLVNVFTGDSIGELVNITVEGLMLMTQEEVETQSVFQFELSLPEPIANKNKIQFGVDCLWCRKDPGFNHHWAGFQIIDADEDTIAILAELIHNFART